MSAYTDRVAVVTVSFNGKADTDVLLGALAVHYPDVPVAVVENGRPQYSNKDVEVVRLPENRGFGSAANAGIKFARARWSVRWVWLLNNDCTVPPGALEPLVKTATRTNALLVSPTIVRLDGQLWYDGGSFDPWQCRVRHHRDRKPERDGARACREVSFVTGCAPLVNVDSFVELGGFNEDYFMYWEDVDLCTRASRSGMRLLHTPESRIVHAGSRSSGAEGERSVLFYRQDLRNRRILMAQLSHAQRLTAAVYSPLYVLRLVAHIAFRERSDRAAKLRAIASGIARRDHAAKVWQR